MDEPGPVPDRAPIDDRAVIAPLDGAAVTAALAAAIGDRVGRVVVVPRTASTSTDLLEALLADPMAWPDRSVLVADHQTAGRGRTGRTWSTPARAALTASVLLRPPVQLDRFGWVPLLAGLAVVQAMGDVAGVRAVVKWPNDVLLAAPDGSSVPGWGTWRKVAGVLGDLVATPYGPAVVVGIGVNVSQQDGELPVPSASSLTLAGYGAVDRTALLAAVVGRLVALDERWRAAGGDARAAGLADECSAVCSTLGARVRVELPGGGLLEGTATGLAADGGLEVTDAAGRVTPVLAGDVRHVRSVGLA